MNRAFKKCLENKKIAPSPHAKSLVKKELSVAEQDLAEARDRLQNERYKYATINSYYAAFHAARALLYSKGLRERSHYCLSVAIEALFVETGELEARFLRDLNNLMSLREKADYGGSFSREAALLCVHYAEEFLERSRSITLK
ncbi:MAG: hypothetical protein A2W03_03035 [Candidatus Aminicenantes bacterium RBG_16_63_16]|nr:MAG: hypothetical protein A2W03_03035 [Candidatus Aminicenantes bacterium RBG_16_63_16]